MSRIYWNDYIEERKEVMLGRPVFKGTRITVEMVLKALRAGTIQEDLLSEFPQLKADHIRAALLFAEDDLNLGV